MWALLGKLANSNLAKCVDTYIALCAMHNPPAPTSTAGQPVPVLTTAFPANANGGASMSASMTSPTTPFSQSTLPSKSLLSRQDSIYDPSLPGGGNAGVPGAHPSPLALQRSVQKNLQTVIKRIFESCYRAGAYRQVVGIAIEARNLDVLREAIQRASQDSKQSKKPSDDGPSKSEELMEYVLDICMNVVQERGLRTEVR
jgi:26S proteasome regulatory subunit N2